jgi:hypothetical protein
MSLRVHLKPKPRWAYKPGSGESARERKDERENGSKRAILCARCGHTITNSDQRIRVQGLHKHAQVNPHGYIWHFGCFAHATGCAPDGKPSTEFAWFAGCSWQIEICRGCSLHLGWRFRGGDRDFHGLILDRIVEAETPAP